MPRSPHADAVVAQVCRSVDSNKDTIEAYTLISGSRAIAVGVVVAVAARAHCCRVGSYPVYKRQSELLLPSSSRAFVPLLFRTW